MSGGNMEAARRVIKNIAAKPGPESALNFNHDLRKRGFTNEQIDILEKELLEACGVKHVFDIGAPKPDKPPKKTAAEKKQEKLSDDEMIRKAGLMGTLQLPHPYHVTEDGSTIRYPLMGSDGTYLRDAHNQIITEDICPAFAHAHLKRKRGKSAEWGLSLSFTDADGNEIAETLDAARLSGAGGAETIGRLRSAGFAVRGGRCEEAVKRLFLELLARRDLPKLHEADKPGLHRNGDAFACPSGSVLYRNAECAKAEETYLPAAICMKDTAPAGTEAASLDTLAACFEMPSEDVQFPLCALAGFAGAIVQATGELSAGIGLQGTGGTGKTSAGYVMASVWGNPALGSGVAFTAAGTKSANEASLRTCTGSAAYLDDASAMLDPRDMKALFFGAASGSGSRRMHSATNSNRDVITWSTFPVFSFERSPAQLLAKVGEDSYKGLVRRFPVVQCGNVKVTPDHWHRIEACMTNYGHLGPRFGQWFISAGHATPEGADKLRAMIQARAAEIAGTWTEGEDAARRFAVLSIAGEMLKECGILPASTDVAGVITRAWATFAESDEAEPMDTEETAVKTLLRYLARSFNHTVHPAVPRTDNSMQAYPLNREAVAYYEEEGKEPSVVHVVREHFVKLSGGAVLRMPLAKALHKRGLLARNDAQGMYHFPYTPGHPGLESYRLNWRKCSEYLGAEAALPSVWGEEAQRLAAD